MSGKEGEIFSGSKEEQEESALQYYTSTHYTSNIAKTGTPGSGIEALSPHSPKKKTETNSSNSWYCSSKQN